jgi:hypothetical protein
MILVGLSTSGLASALVNNNVASSMSHLLKQKNINADKMKRHIRKINSGAATLGSVLGPILGSVLY